MKKIKTKTAPLINTRKAREKRERLAGLRVLVADQNIRTAALVRSILFSFGFRNMELVTSGAEALSLLRDELFDLIITEWDMAPVDGIALVQTLRTGVSQRRVRRDVPIIMLTANTEIGAVETARDAGVTEFLAKPFSAQTVSNRIIQIIDHPRAFVESPSFVGPCRRRRENPLPGSMNRRRTPEEKAAMLAAGAAAVEKILPPNHALAEQLQPFKAEDLLNAEAVATAEEALTKTSGELVEWAADYVGQLEAAYQALYAAPDSRAASARLLAAAHAITTQAGTFGYALGTEVGGMLVAYLDRHPNANANTLVVIRKHIDTVNAVFTQNIKDNAQEIGAELLASLKKLTVKLG